MIRPIHPFPARMAPEIAIAELKALPKASTIFDPMMGSGTVLRHAVEFGHKAIGYDMDPLAVLMSRVWSTPMEETAIAAVTKAIWDVLPSINVDQTYLPWIDDDEETGAFVRYWFGKRQQDELRRLAFVIKELGAAASSEQQQAIDVHRVALSRIIITKSSGASLAADVSHSRPHKVMKSSKYDVFSAFRTSIGQLSRRVCLVPKTAHIRTSMGDARVLRGARKQSADVVLTSPPYLNAIDYMRGHKLSLVWLGHSISSLRKIRSSSIGAERKADQDVSASARRVQEAMVDASDLEAKHLAMVERYAIDLVQMMVQTKRVLKPGGKAILVVGNSCLREAFIRNSDGVISAATAAGLRLRSERVRELPASSRYLPMPKRNDSALGKRMRTESVLTFTNAT